MMLERLSDGSLDEGYSVVQKYMKDLRSMMEGMLDLNRRNQLPDRERAICAALLLRLMLNEEVFDPEDVDEAKVWLSTIEGSRRSRKSQDMYSPAESFSVSKKASGGRKIRADAGSKRGAARSRASRGFEEEEEDDDEEEDEDEEGVKRAKSRSSKGKLAKGKPAKGKPGKGVHIVYVNSVTPKQPSKRKRKEEEDYSVGADPYELDDDTGIVFEPPMRTIRGRAVARPPNRNEFTSAANVLSESEKSAPKRAKKGLAEGRASGGTNDLLIQKILMGHKQLGDDDEEEADDAAVMAYADTHGAGESGSVAL